MPLKYGLYKIAWRRLKRCQDEEIWDRILKKLVTITSIIMHLRYRILR
ncbi:MAG: hypothetical protein LZ168_07160 [Thaumarchaeota archaeon]|jgi:hypothetical protein|nr:hypothetical protein [Candidatus Geocrenenecus arthurdayi]